MIPARFDYEVAEGVEQALELLGRDDDAKLLAGGHSLIPAMKLRLARPSLLVDIGRLSELAYVRDAGTTLAIGALTRHKALRDDPLLQEHCPIVSTTAGLIGDPQVRHRGTIGGSLAHGDPASDLPAVMLALGAEHVVRGRDGERRVPATEFFTGVFETAVGPGEMLVEILVPKLGPLDRLVVPQVQPARAGLGDGRRRGARPSRQRQGRRRVDRADEHGRHARAGEGGRGRARERRLARGRRRADGGGNRAARRHRRQRRVPQAPRPRPRPARARRGARAIRATT